jgi:hypothetical protein
MDDATSVTFIRRTWDSSVTATAGSSSNGQQDYSVLTTVGAVADNSSGAAPSTTRGVVHYIEVPPPGTSHRLSDYLQHDYAGSANGVQLNVLPPQSLPVSDNIYSLVANKYVFDANLRVNSLPYFVPRTGAPQAKFGKEYGTPPGNCTLAYPFGYGRFYDESLGLPMDFTAGANVNAAYNTNQATIVFPAEHAKNQSGVIRYPAYVNTGADNHVYTDLVVNIANPGAWPYAQPLNGPNNFVGFSNFQFPTREPDSTLAGQTFSFENIGVLTEAARGNLDIEGAENYFTNALLDRGSVYSTTSGVIAS